MPSHRRHGRLPRRQQNPADERSYRSQTRRSTLSRKDGQSARIVGRGTRTVPTRATGTAGPLPTTTPIFKGCKHHHIVDPMTRHTRKWVAASSMATGTFTELDVTTYCNSNAAKAITELDVDTKCSRHTSISEPLHMRISANRRDHRGVDGYIIDGG